MEGVAGATAIVTGAGNGIGAAVAESLAGAGASVAVFDLDAAAAERTADRIAVVSAGGRAVAFGVDVSDPDAVESTVDKVESALGPVGILVNVAGILRPALVAELSDSDWADTFAVNVNGVFHCCRAVSKRMRTRRTGAIVTVGSNAGNVPRQRMAAYAASKAAAAQFTRCLGLELASSGIRCNVVSPGATDTAMQSALWEGGNGASKVITGDLDSYRTGIPLGRLADPADIADAVLFLVSDRARHITLHDLNVDGGSTPRC